MVLLLPAHRWLMHSYIDNMCKETFVCFFFCCFSIWIGSDKVVDAIAFVPTKVAKRAMLIATKPIRCEEHSKRSTYEFDYVFINQHFQISFSCFLSLSSKTIECIVVPCFELLVTSDFYSPMITIHSTPIRSLCVIHVAFICCTAKSYRRQQLTLICMSYPLKVEAEGNEKKNARRQLSYESKYMSIYTRNVILTNT